MQIELLQKVVAGGKRLFWCGYMSFFFFHYFGEISLRSFDNFCAMNWEGCAITVDYF